MHTSTHTVLYDPDGLIEAGLPLDREPYECLVNAVLAWTDQDILTASDLVQLALQLTGHARALAANVRRHAAALPENDGRGALADVILREAAGCLSQPIEEIEQREQTLLLASQTHRGPAADGGCGPGRVGRGVRRACGPACGGRPSHSCRLPSSCC
ncbi:DUF6415 family natural product biosynthesis protein [Streptomyces sp. NPDC016309]|uniref:DUF6415 family natural product biosynthesis protein n=1 Tax=Streptomyces sp. NPDC016309 TaxID=3364965 RepID=UPI0036FA79B9